MKKYDYKKLALLGLASGLVAANTAFGDAPQNNKTMMQQAPMTEDQLMSQLSPEGKAMYQSLDAEGKKLALQLANQGCKGQNTCKGLNSCKTDKNSCMGLGGCKGTSPGPFKDKNDAVKMAAKKMAEKRQQLQNK